ncbi:MAG: primosomal protein N' [Bacteroidales bacterium]|jgi:primosomal protein N' (replication factor Y)|nr:primosomal protein N' [Bacteroidales bacterium]
MDIYIDVILPLPLWDFFTYHVPADMAEKVEVGKRALVPFGRNKFYAVIIYQIHENKPQHYAVKEILSVLDEFPIVNEHQLKFWKWITEYYLCTYGEVMAVALPSAFKLTSETKIWIHPDFSGDISCLTEKELSIVTALTEKKTLTIEQVEKLLSKNYVISQIKNLIDKEVIIVCEEVKERYTPRKEVFLSISEPYASDESALSAVLDEMEKSAQTQSQADTLLLFISALQKNKTAYIRKSDFIKQKQVTEAKIATLVKKKILSIQAMEVSRLKLFEQKYSTSSIQLNSYQQQAIHEIEDLFQTCDKVLLHGVTGSGKTELYIKLIQKTINEGKQVLYLLPEIALTMQIITRLSAYFGNDIGVYHSHFNDMERIEIWNKTLKNDQTGYKIILGARSSIFLPFSNLGLIIVDEEHDYSYKQFDPSPRYNARDAAVILASLHQAKICFGTATPSMETYFNTQQKKYGLVSLYHRYGGLQLPEIQLIDIRKERRKDRLHSYYTQTLITAIENALAEKEQVILFQNRRGFSLHLECNMCGHVPCCKYCDVTLTYHKKSHELRCHYCGYTKAVPEKCPECKNNVLEMRGLGTERVEEEIEIFFPQAKVARLDYDSTRAKNAYQRILSDFGNGEIDILVGTQMVTKGLDFDNVSVVGILNADNMLNYPDFRSLERSFQLMMQVSGRAGRKNKQGCVLIQTYNPKHEVFEYLQNNDYYALFERLLKERNLFHYPPLVRLIKITLKHKNQTTLDRASTALAEKLKSRLGKAVLGPEFPLITKIKNLYQKDILIKLSLNKQMQDNKEFIFCQTRDLCRNISFKSVRINIDVDPY